MHGDETADYHRFIIWMKYLLKKARIFVPSSYSTYGIAATPIPDVQGQITMYVTFCPQEVTPSPEADYSPAPAQNFQGHVRRRYLAGVF